MTLTRYLTERSFFITLWKFLKKDPNMAEETAEEEKEAKEAVTIGATVVIKDFAEKLGIPVTQVIAELMKNGIMSGQNERIDFETAEIVAAEFGREVNQEEGKEEDGDGVAKLEQQLAEGEENKVGRPPVVVVLGHVDHGKTKLLDAIRQTNVVEGEAGGITQHIGAYQVTVHPKDKRSSRASGKRGAGGSRDDRTITFIDTPGHEAFTAMRSRGARVADIAILVIAADDGIQQQTKEAIGIIQRASLPMVVAINKVDRPEANVEKVMSDLAEVGLQPEAWGGKTITVPVSAKNGTGIDDLLDMVLLVADMEKKRIQADPSRHAIGTIIESHVDAGEGPVATVLVQAGMLRPGANLTVGNTWGKVKVLKDWNGKAVKEAGPSFPVQILGLKSSPQVGDILEVVEDSKEFRRLRKKAPQGRVMQKETPLAQQRAEKEESSTDDSAGKEASEEKKEVEELNIVLKADTLGSLEAIEEQLGMLHHDDLKITVVSKGLGNITEADVLRAETSNAILLGFNVPALQAAEDVARGKHISISIYHVIYDLVNDVIAAGESRLSPEVLEELHGELEVLAVFFTKKQEQIFGGRVKEGKILNPSSLKVLRDGQEIARGTLIELESNKVKAKEVPAGSECGVKYHGPGVVQVGDTVQSFTRKEIKKKITVG